MSKAQRNRKSFNNVVLVLVLAAGLAYLFFKGPRLDSFLNLDLVEILLLLAVSFSGYLVLALGFRSLLHIFGVAPSFKEWFGLTVCNHMFNHYLPARGGTVLKAYYLKKKRGLGYSRYAALMAGSVFLVLALFSIVGLAAVLLASVITGRFIFSLAAAFFLIFLAVLLTGLLARRLLSLKIFRKSSRLGLFLSNLRTGLGFFSERRKHTLDFCLLSVFFLLIVAGRLYLCFLALGFGVRFWAVLLITVITEFSFLVPLIPGNLVIKEGIIVFSGGFFGITTDQALSAALLDRAVSLVVIFGFGLIYSKLLLDKMDEKG